jgi:predicted nucleic acid-binding protein
VSIVISDTSCLIAFERIDRLDILPGLYETVCIPPAVDVEFGKQFEWLKVEQLISHRLCGLLNLTLGKGESEAIALAVQLECFLLTDDKQARAMAEQLGLTVKGVLGVLIAAKGSGHVAKVKPIIDDLETNGFRISRSLREEVLRVAAEA